MNDTFADDAARQELADARLLDELRAMWEARDPMPADLIERIQFSLSLEDVDAEVMRLAEELREAVGARGEEEARAITFSSDHLTVMVSINPGREGVRLDGWAHRGGGLDVEARIDGQTFASRCDDGGRFAFEGLPPGLAQLIFHPTPGAQTELPRDVVTPGLKI